MKSYKPSTPFSVPMKLLIPTSTKVQGVLKKVYPEPSEVSDDYLMFGSFKTFGAYESLSNDINTTENTGVIDTWFRPDVKANCRVFLLDDESTYDIVSEPENINRRNQYLQFRVKKVGA